ncbi:hypothetical protein CROQUDRAFT_132793 [Cronartium quercuum f. sp. fusiforme G11]|uniref:Geranylgeranyl transferase type-2 subunit alpha n=1 Tax=Cronartium quercuum f. sp. fusiforme G11 TaxID=708437 RepID=A0A9P6NNZ9_9BASI|nr:hypothetical protein CROQUDRAFT_132793 [Cronartium quercuum f. sp. fusiforme G11]
MHGVKRSKASAVGTREPGELAEEKQRLEEYQVLNKSLLERNAAQDFEQTDSLSLSAALLTLNPEHVTAWAFRRRCLMAISSPVELEEKLKLEMQLTYRSFERHPKAYSIWEHRKWVLNQMKSTDWIAELSLVHRLLKVDGRNFHVWDYRRYLISMISSTDSSTSATDRLKSELAFTTKQIESNFSNFSAWHYRSKVLEPLFRSCDNERESRLKEELEWVRNALWIDPNDQSGWLYHRWLMSHNKQEEIRQTEIQSIKELLEVEPDSKWALATLLQYCPDQTDVLDKLLELDPLRKQRYVDVTNGHVSI